MSRARIYKMSDEHPDPWIVVCHRNEEIMNVAAFPTWRRAMGYATNDDWFDWSNGRA